MATFEKMLDLQCQLGESPVWMPGKDVLVFVDISGRRLHRVTFLQGPRENLAVGTPPSVSPAMESHVRKPRALKTRATETSAVETFTIETLSIEEDIGCVAPAAGATLAGTNAAAGKPPRAAPSPVADPREAPAANSAQHPPEAKSQRSARRRRNPALPRR